jgi:hypothetical protein
MNAGLRTKRFIQANWGFADVDGATVTSFGDVVDRDGRGRLRDAQSRPVLVNHCLLDDRR